MKDRVKALLRAADGFQQRHASAGLPYAVLRKFSEDQAGNLAALVAYYAFFSIFPLLMAATTVLGFVLQGDPGLQKSIEKSWLSQLPIVGSSLGQNHGLTGSAAALVVGVLLALWSGLAVARTAQTAFNSVYNVPMAERPAFVQKTLRSLMLIVTIGVGLIVATAISGAVTSTGTSLHLGVGAQVGGYVVALAIDVAMFTIAFNWLTVRDVTWRQALPGATFAAVAWFVLQNASTAIVNHKLHGSQGTYGQFALVIALLSWFYLAAQFVLMGAELNVVLRNRLWPRGLVDRPQTEADFRAFERYAEEQRYEHPERVDTGYADGAEQRRRDEAVAGTETDR